MSSSRDASPTLPQGSHRVHVCPWWLGWTLTFPGRRWFLDPEALLDPLVKPGCRALEVGPGTGFFTVPLAERVGPEGRVWCVDLQPRMLRALGRRLRRRELDGRVVTRACSATDLGVSDLEGTLDLAVMIYVLHEVPDPKTTLCQVSRALRPGGHLLLVEPAGHCPPELFATEIQFARELGLVLQRERLGKGPRRGQVALLERAGTPF